MIQRVVLLLLLIVVVSPAALAEPPELKVGMIGLDTSHAIAFTKILNDADAPEEVSNCRVIVAYPKGSPDIASSTSRVPKYTEQMIALGVEIVPSIDVLLKQVDCVLLETNDGRPHLEQVLPCFKAGKRVLIDKPMAGSLADVVAIFEASKKYDVPTFCSSSLRFAKSTLAVRGGSIGKVTYCQTQSPCSREKTHPDLYWYGIHGCESLYTVMGTGCETVQRSETEDGKIKVIGNWSGGRTGIYVEGKGYSGTAKGTMGESPVGSYDGYRPLVVEIVKFFRTGVVPVAPEETIELYTFMEAADESKRQDGKAVSMKDVLNKARDEATAKLSN